MLYHTLQGACSVSGTCRGHHEGGPRVPPQGCRTDTRRPGHRSTTMGLHPGLKADRFTPGGTQLMSDAWQQFRAG